MDNIVLNKSDYSNKELKSATRCPNPKHEDKKPSASLFEHGIYCHKCAKFFPFQNYKYTKFYSNNNLKANEFHKNLKNSTDDSEIIKYLKDRKIFSNYLLKEFLLGFDYKKNSLVFPIKNSYGDINGFGFRKIDNYSVPKYWNSKANDKNGNLLFDKGNNLFGIDKITDKCDHLIICEGYICVISAFKSGFKDNICFVALMGTALGEKHLPILHYIKKKNGIKKISLMLDKDSAGNDATVRAIEILIKGNIFPCVIKEYEQNDNYLDCKDIDEILRKKDGKNYLKKLLNNDCHEFFDYLLKENIPDDILKNIVLKNIRDDEKKSEYATKLCVERNLYKNLKFLEIHTYKEIISLSPDKAKEYFFEEDHFFNNKLPKYFTFKKVLEWAKQEVFKIKNNNSKLISLFKNIEESNYKLLGNKDGEFAWRKYQIINPVLYIELANAITDEWSEIQKYFDQQKNPPNIICTSLPVIEKKDNFINNSARQILHWWEKTEQSAIKKSLEYKYVIHTDIVDCYGSIYTHSIPWALHGKPHIKDLVMRSNSNNKKAKKDLDKLLGHKIDKILQCMSNNQTNGIPQGSVIMDLIAEILLRYLDNEISIKIKKDKAISEYFIIRYRDDYRIFSNEIGSAKRILKHISDTLSENGSMRLSPNKTEVLDCTISGSIKKDKLYFLENFKDHNIIRRNLLNIYLFSKRFPNSGSIVKLLKYLDIQVINKIKMIQLDLLKNKFEYKVIDFDPIYSINILAEIMYRNPRTYPMVCKIIHHILNIMNNEDRKNVIGKIFNKMKDVPNSELLNIWLERMTLIHHEDTDGWDIFFKKCQENNTLLYKQYSKDTIWKFPPEIDFINMPSILDDEIIEVLDRAKNKIKQKKDVNKSIFGPLTDEEVDDFAKYY